MLYHSLFLLFSFAHLTLYVLPQSSISEIYCTLSRSIELSSVQTAISRSIFCKKKIILSIIPWRIMCDTAKLPFSNLLRVLHKITGRTSSSWISPEGKLCVCHSGVVISPCFCFYLFYIYATSLLKFPRIVKKTRPRRRS